MTCSTCNAASMRSVYHHFADACVYAVGGRREQERMVGRKYVVVGERNAGRSTRGRQGAFQEISISTERIQKEVPFSIRHLPQQIRTSIQRS